MLTVSLETLPAGILPSMAQEFEKSESAIGWLVSAWGLTVILTSIPLVRRLSAFDRRAVTAWSLAFTGLSGVGTALAPTYPLAMASRVLGAVTHGVFWALVIVYASSMLAPRFLAAGIALVTGGSQLAAAGVIPGAAALSEVMSWRGIYAGVAIGAVVLAIIMRVALPPDIPQGAAATTEAPSPPREPRLLGPLTLAVVALLFVFSHFVVYTYATVLFAPSTGESDRVGLYLAVIGGFSILGLIISGPLANRWPRFGLPVYLLIFAAGMALIIPAAVAPRLVGLALWGLMFGTIGPLAQALALRFSPQEFRPTVSAAMVVTFNLGISSGSFAGGLATDRAGAQVTVYVALVALGIGAALAWWAGRHLHETPRVV